MSLYACWAFMRSLLSTTNGISRILSYERALLTASVRYGLSDQPIGYTHGTAVVVDNVDLAALLACLLLLLSLFLTMRRKQLHIKSMERALIVVHVTLGYEDIMADQRS